MLLMKNVLEYPKERFVTKIYFKITVAREVYQYPYGR